MARFLALRIIAGKLEYSKVPDGLKQAVASVLEELGHSELAG